MSGRLADVEARIGTVDKLSAVVTAMRGLAAARAQEARRHQQSVQLYAATVAQAIGQALALAPGGGAAPQGSGKGPHTILAFCAEQGFAGSFNARVLDEAATLMAQEDCALMVVGDRGVSVAAEQRLPVAWSAPMISHPDQVEALASRLTDALYARIEDPGLTRATLLHAQPGGPSGIEVVQVQIVPFDLARFDTPTPGNPPLITLPPAQLLARLIEEYVFAEICAAAMLSFAAENEARMRAMIAAHGNVSDMLVELTAQSRLLRQKEITDEIVELASGSLAQG